MHCVSKFPGAVTSRHKDKIETPGLLPQEQIKNRKHAAFYSPSVFALFPFLVSCFGSLDPSAVFSLADPELQRHKAFIARQSSACGSFCSVSGSGSFLPSDLCPYWSCRSQGFCYASFDFLVFRCRCSFLALSSLGTALARQIYFLRLSSLILPPL